MGALEDAAAPGPLAAVTRAWTTARRCPGTSHSAGDGRQRELGGEPLAVPGDALGVHAAEVALVGAAGVARVRVEQLPPAAGARQADAVLVARGGR
jgi:hypothetical protein